MHRWAGAPHSLLDRRRTICNAGKKNHKSSSPWQSSRAPGSSTASSSQAAAKLSDAAKAAAKRAAQFAKQRQQRAYQLAQEEQQDAGSYGSTTGFAFNTPSSRKQGAGLQSPAQTAALAATAAANAAAGQYSDLQPYVEVVCAHLKQQTPAGASGSSSTSSGSGRGRGAKKAAARSLLEAHTAVFQAALDLELQQEWTEAEDRLKSWPQSRLSSEGVALFGLAAAPDGAVARDVVVRFFVPERALPFHSFSQGDILLVSQGDPLGDSHEAVVIDFSSRWIRLAMNPIAAAAVAAAAGGGWGRGSSSGSTGSRGSWRPIWRLDLFANTVSHERCSEALHRFAEAASGQQQGSGATASDRQVLLSGSLTQGQLQQQEALCRMLAGVLPSETSLDAAAGQTPPWVKTSQGRERLSAARAAVKTLVQDKRLNPSQASAITAALTRTLTLWQGPPGTGKTTTLLRFCEAALSVLPQARGQLLAVAASNVAVDQLVTGLLSLGVRVVRVGQPAKVTPALRAVTLETLAAATAPGQAAVKLRQQLIEAAAATRGQSGGGSSGRGGRGGGRGRRSSIGGGQEGGGVAGRGMWEQMLALEAAAAAEVLGGAQVVAATCVGAGDPVLQERFFEVLVLDEATQAPEPAALVAAAQKVQSMVLVGDPQQLPPTVRSQEAQRLGLGTSLFDRVQAMGLKPMLLDTQYRMHPKLAEFPSARFYNGLLQSWPKPSDRPLPAGLPWPNPQVPVMFIQCKGPEARTAASFSISRLREAAALSSSEEDTHTTAADTRNRSNRSSSSSRPANSGSSNSSSSRPANSGSNGSSSSSSSSGGGGGGYSFFNAAEAAVVVDCVQRLLAAGLQAQDVCVITPYSGQVRSIQQLLGPDVSTAAGPRQQQQQQHQRRPPVQQQQQQQQQQAPPGNSARQPAAGEQRVSRGDSRGRATAASPETATAATAATAAVGVLEVKSVDGFQGREKEVVVFSAVRSNSSGRVGFLSDARRLNVALTRAKRGLVVVGDAGTLRGDRVWAAWLAWAQKHGAVLEGGLQSFS